MAARVRTDPRTPQLKALATSFLENGQQEFSLDVNNLARRERNKVRMHINRWLRDNGWRGATHYDPDAETLSARVIARREGDVDEVP